MMSLYKSKICDRGIARVVLNRPEIHNAFNDELISSLTNHFYELQENDDVRLITISGEGKSFCAGADLNWMKSMANYSKEENYNDSQNLFGLFKVINDCKKPVLGKINGHALGGGVGLVSVCDYALSHEKAKFGFTEVRLGLVPAVISPFCINKIGEFANIDIDDFDRILKVNLRTPFLLCQAVIPHMKGNSWGRIVNITSIFGNVTKEYRASYSSSKFGLDGMTVALASEVSGMGILANSVGPGFIDTDLTRSVLGEKGIAEVQRQIPIKRLGQVNEIASLVSWLVSNENSYISGQNIMIDGGFTRV